MQLLLLRHWRTPFTTRQDNGLCALRDGKLTAQLGCRGQEAADAGRDVVRHLMAVEEGHLLLNGSKDAGVARMQAHNEMSPVIMLPHQGTLFLQIHIGR